MRSFGIEADDDEWAKVIAVNQQGVFLGMRAVIPEVFEGLRPGPQCLWGSGLLYAGSV
jgi:NAD(P)-dependent dehydrogenase (short-subunit alcohol dehydrogenase family)